MEFLRTANAGGLLKMDGISILLDGVCAKVEPYAQTPKAMLDQLSNNYPDAVGFTHRHPDHFLESFACDYRNITGKLPIIAVEDRLSIGGVFLHSIPTRHLGKAEAGLMHSSFLIEGGFRVLFAGDAAPTALKGIAADVLIAPYAYANSAAGLKAAAATGAKHLILVHMPENKNDAYGIWDSVVSTISKDCPLQVYIPQMGEIIRINETSTAV